MQYSPGDDNTCSTHQGKEDTEEDHEAGAHVCDKNDGDDENTEAGQTQVSVQFLLDHLSNRKVCLHL